METSLLGMPRRSNRQDKSPGGVIVSGQRNMTAPACFWSPTNCTIHESVADQHGPHLALPVSVGGGVPSRLLVLRISQAKLDMASKRPRGRRFR